MSAVDKLDTLKKQLISVLDNDPRYAEKLGPGMARDLFMLGAQSALHVIAVTSKPGDLRSVMLAIQAMHKELGEWLQMPTSSTEH